MFGDNKDVLTAIKKQEDSHLKMALEMGRVGNALVNIEKMLSKTVASYTKENIVLQTYPNTFASNGYMYNSLIIGDSAVSDNVKLFVADGGLSYSVVLLSGDNAINIPDGATYYVTTTSGNAVSAILMRYNTPGNNDTNVSIQGSANVNANVTGSTIRQPVDVQSHLSQLITDFNAVSIGASTASAESGYHSCDGYLNLNINFMNDAATTAYVDLHWSMDGTNYHSADYGILPSGTSQRRTIQVPVKAPYFQLSVYNGDTVAHTFSVWTYLTA